MHSKYNRETKGFDIHLCILISDSVIFKLIICLDAKKIDTFHTLNFECIFFKNQISYSKKKKYVVRKTI